MPVARDLSLSRIRMLALAGAALGATVVLVVTWTLLAPQVEPALGALAVPALAGPILHPRIAPRVFTRYLLIGMLTASVVLLLGWAAA